MPLHSRPIQPGDPFAPDDFIFAVEQGELPEPSNFEQMKAAMSLTPTGSLMQMQGFTDDPDFVPDWKSLPAKYDPFIDELSDARSQDEFATKQRRIDSELEAYDTLRRGGGSGIAWGIAAGIADPITLPLWFLVPTKLLQGASTAKTAGVVAGFAATDAAISETLLQATQETRTLEDSFVSVGASALLGSLLGTGGGYIANRMGPAKVAQLTAAIREELTDTVRVRRAQGESQSIGAGQSATTFAQESPLRAPARVPGATINNPIQRLLWDKYSVTAKRVVDELTPHNVLKQKHLEGVAPEHTPLHTVIDQATDRAAADIILAVKKARRELRARGIRMTEDEVAVMAGRAATRGDQSPHKEILDVIKAFRNPIEDWTSRAVRLGIFSRLDFDNTLALSYFPRIYDTDAISRNYTKWRTLLSNHFKASGDPLEPAEIDAAVDAVTMTIRGTPVGRMTMPREIEGAFSGRFKERTIKIPDIQLEPFLVKDIRIGLQHYMRSVAPEVVLKERFGPDNVTLIRDHEGFKGNIAQIEQGILDDYSLAINTAADKGLDVTKIIKSRDQALADVRHILGRITGLDNPGRQFGARASTEIRSWIASAMLGNIVLASMVDHANVVLQHGLGNFIKTRPAAWTFGKLTKTAKQDFDAFAIGMDGLLSTRMMKFADIEDVPASQGAMTFGQKRAAPAVFRYTGANLWNRSVKRGAAVAAQNRIIDDALRYAKLGKIRTAKLASAGIDGAWAQRFANQYRKYGEKRQGAHYANTNKWADIEAAERFEQILHREVDTTIITPIPGDTPIILDNSVGKFLTQFKKTLLAMQTSIVIPLSQRMSYGDVSAINALVMMVGLGMAQEYLRMAIRHEFDARAINAEREKLAVADWIRAGIDRSGASMFFLESFNVVDHFAQGRVSNALGLSESSRYFFRSQGFASFVPALGVAEDVGGVLGAPFKEGGFTTSDLHTMRRLIPFQNAYYAAWLFDQAEQSTAEVLNLPEGKRRKRRYAKRKVKF